VMAVGRGCGVRRDVERLRVQGVGSPGWGANRAAGAEARVEEEDATWADANAATSSLGSETSDIETARVRDETLPPPLPPPPGPPPPARSRPVAEAVSPPPLPPLPSPGSLLCSSTLSTLMLLRRPRCRSRSMPCHISSVTPKRSRHLRSWRARESGRVSGLWHMAQGEGWPPCLAVLLRCRERSRGVPN
jgi:hypothetical protein